MSGLEWFGLLGFISIFGSFIWPASFCRNSGEIRSFLFLYRGLDKNRWEYTLAQNVGSGSSAGFPSPPGLCLARRSPT